jgi:NDP-sugar pyrophosphorylase family protein
LGPPSQCVILVDGLGAQPTGRAAERPIALADIAGAPFLESLIVEANRRGFARLLLLASHGASAVVAFADALERSRRFRCDIEILVVPEGIGPAGALRVAAPRLEERFLLLDGHSWFDFNCVCLPTRPQDPISQSASRHDRHRFPPRGRREFFMRAED